VRGKKEAEDIAEESNGSTSHDSTHGIWDEDVSFDGNILRVGEREINTFSERKPKNIAWSDLGVDIVVEPSGRFANREAASGHLEGDAKKVVVSAPAKGAETTTFI
jgi:glyceraldehyde 3-phosphate dehydrogenase